MNYFNLYIQRMVRKKQATNQMSLGNIYKVLSPSFNN